MAANNIDPELIAELTRRGLLKEGKLTGTASQKPIDSSINLIENFTKGLLQTPGAQPGPGLVNKAAFYGGKYGPGAAGASLGSVAAPGGGTALGAALGAGAGAAMGKSLQNLSQTVSNQLYPGSAATKTPEQLIAEPTTEAIAQGLMTGTFAKLLSAGKEPAMQYATGTTGVKENLMRRAFDNIGKIMSSPSVSKAGELIGSIAEKAGIKTGTDGYKLATAEILGQKAATDQFSSATTLQMAELARDIGPDALSDQAKYSLAEGLRKAMSAPKYADPHGPVAQNFRMFATQLAGLEDMLETSLPGYDSARAGYANSLAKEALGSFTPLNKNLSVNQLKTGAQLIMGGKGLADLYKGDHADAAEMLMTASLMSPMITGRLLQGVAAAGATQIPQTIGRTGLSAIAQPASQSMAGGLTAALGSMQIPQAGQFTGMSMEGQR